MSAKLSNKEILREILSCKEALGLDTLPSAAELYEYGVYSAQLTRVGGLKNVSQMTRIPMKPRRTSYKKQNESYIDHAPIQTADLKNWSAERQKAETLRMVGSIDTSVYGVEKVRAL